MASKLFPKRDTLSRELEKVTMEITEYLNNQDRCSKVSLKVSVAEELFVKLEDVISKLALLKDEPQAADACQWLVKYRESHDQILEEARQYIKDSKVHGKAGSLSNRSGSHRSGKSNRTDLSNASTKLAQLKLKQKLLEDERLRQADEDAEFDKVRLDLERQRLENERKQRDLQLKRETRKVADEAKLLEVVLESGSESASEDNLSIPKDKDRVQNWVDTSLQGPSQDGLAQQDSVVVSSGSQVGASAVVTSVAPAPFGRQSAYVSQSVCNSAQVPVRTCAPSVMTHSQWQHVPPSAMNVTISAPMSQLVTSTHVSYSQPLCYAPNMVSAPEQTWPTATLHPAMIMQTPVNGYGHAPSQTAFRGSSDASRGFEKSLPKWKLTTFRGDPLEWPEWRSMFRNTVMTAHISDAEKMNHLKTLLEGKAKQAIAGFAFGGSMFQQAWDALERKYGRPHVIVSSQLAKLNGHPSVKMHNSESLIDYALIVASFVNVLTELGYVSDLQSASNMHTALSKLPPNLKEKWFEYLSSLQDDSPDLNVFNNWLQHVAETHERLVSCSRGNPSSESSQPKTVKTKTVSTTLATDAKTGKVKDSSCMLCKGAHLLTSCTAFKAKSPTERAEFAQSKSLCFSCLIGQHFMRKCSSQKACGQDGCKKQHHRLLHGADRVNPKASKELPTTSAANVASSESSSAMNIKSGKGLLQVVGVAVEYNGKKVQTYALCDSGSTHSWVSSDLQSSLGLRGTSTRISLAAFGSVSEQDTMQCEVNISHCKEGPSCALSVLVKEGFSVGTDILDIASLKRKYPHLSPVPEEKIDFRQVSVLLGQDAYSLIRPLEYRTAGQQEPWAVRLPLGWVVSGRLPGLQREESLRTSTNFASSEADLAAQVKRWWDIESYASACAVDTRSKEDKRALEILRSQTHFNGERYVIPLLWAKDDTKMPNNFAVAKAQLLSLEKRLDKDPGLRKRYQETIDVDRQKGYIRQVKPEELRATANDNQWYLPHHPVLNPNKPEKVRRVCNAASKFRGISLNDALVTGPDLLKDLVGILLRFRTAPVAVSADIEAMFLQVEVTECDQRALRFLWREDPSREIQVEQYTRHIFGGKPSPTCAIYAVEQTARDHAKDFKEASEAVLKDLYMDDFLKSLESTTTAINLCRDIVKLLHRGGFNLTKFASNDKEVLRQLQADGIEVSGAGLEGESSLHVLGIKWSTENDTLVVSRGTTKVASEAPTQREVLSCVSSVFDPLGLVAPFTVRARLLLKRIWQAQGQSWDDPVDQESQAWFRVWVSELQSVQHLEIPRQYFRQAVSEQQVHVFADASLEAMCAVVYLRGVLADGSVQVSFVVGKARVSPFRSQTIPKLELQAAVIGCRLYKLVCEQLQCRKFPAVFWSDSTTVLQWIRGSHRKQTVYVANRVAEVLETSTVDQWKHVPGEFNPADCGTRGMSPQDLADSGWLHGPAFLKGPECNWPEQRLDVEPEVVVAKASADVREPPIDWTRFSSFSRLVRVFARLRLVCTRQKRPSAFLTHDDLEEAKRSLWLLVQRESFPEEARCLHAGDELPAKSRLGSLSPFQAADGLIRAKGRLRKAAHMTFDAKHPVVLRSHHPAVKLFLLQLHNDNHHEGTEYLRSIVQQNFWILHLRSTLREIKRKCVKCAKARALTLKPEMADLPIERLAGRVFPFANTGIDYFGPFEVKIGRKSAKRWCSLFCCLTTRAVHIEVCHSLEADACVMAIKRFVARRGQPRMLVSDNGTNFVGAHREFRQCLENWNKGAVEAQLAQNGIKWKFNPPSAPHFGGVWERLVRSCKRAMFNILGGRRLTDELLQTTMCLVEQTLNARPLTAVSSDPEDLEALTPNHFLLGRPSVCLPTYWTEPSDINCRKLFRQAETYADMVWQRWLNEYVPDLNKRSKWHTQRAGNLAIGDLVWLIEPTQPRSRYPLGRVVQVFPGDDGTVRSVKVKTSTGTYTRPVVKLAPVPACDPSDQGRLCSGQPLAVKPAASNSANSMTSSNNT